MANARAIVNIKCKASYIDAPFICEGVNDSTTTTTPATVPETATTSQFDLTMIELLFQLAKKVDQPKNTYNINGTNLNNSNNTVLLISNK